MLLLRWGFVLFRVAARRFLRDEAIAGDAQSLGAKGSSMGSTMNNEESFITESMHVWFGSAAGIAAAFRQREAPRPFRCEAEGSSAIRLSAKTFPLS